MAENKTAIVITAEDKTAAAFASAKAGLEKFSSAYSSIAGIAGAGVVAGLVASAKATIDLGDTMNDLSQKVGIGVQALAGWQLAANQSGTSLETVAKGVKGLSQYMVQNSDALAKAGITATDANGALVQLADIFAAMPDGIEKTALAVKLFGKSGMDMIPMLNQGSRGLAEAQEKARAYGEKMAALAPLADKFNDQLAEMAMSSKVLGLSVATEALPTLIRFAEELKTGKEIAGGWISAMWEFGVLLSPGELPKSLEETRGALERLHAEMARGKAQNLADNGQTDLSDLDKQIGLLERRKKYLDAMQRQQVMVNASKLGDYRDARDLARDPSTIDAMRKAKILAGNDNAAKVAKSVGSVNDYSARVNEAVAGAINSSAVVKSRELAAQIEALDKLFFDAGLDMDIYTSAMQKLTGQTDKASKEAGRLAQLLEATPTAKLEETRRDMELLAGALEAGHISEEQFIEATQARLGTLGQSVKEVDNFARDMGLTFASAFEDAVIGGKSLQDVINGLGQDIERIILRKTVTEPLGNGVADMIKGSSFGGSGGLLGGIKNLFGFATGGAFTVGGAGGTDSQVVAFKATPGEEVTVRTPGQQAGGGSIVIHQSISVDSRSDQASIMQAMIAAKNAAVAEIYSRQRRGA